METYGDVELSHGHQNISYIERRSTLFTILHSFLNMCKCPRREGYPILVINGKGCPHWTVLPPTFLQFQKTHFQKTQCCPVIAFPRPPFRLICSVFCDPPTTTRKSFAPDTHSTNTIQLSPFFRSHSGITKCWLQD